MTRTNWAFALQGSSYAARLPQVFVLIVIALGAASQIAWGQAAPSKEHQIKAALLLNFIQFTQWPEGTFSAPDSPITIGILGDDSFGAALEQTLKDESVDGRKLVVKRSKQFEDLKVCQLLFLSATEKDRMTDILKNIRDANILTVGEMDQFVQRGGIINFYLDSGKVRFEINAELAAKKGFKLNSQLLKRAKIVNVASQ